MKFCLHIFTAVMCALLFFAAHDVSCQSSQLQEFEELLETAVGGKNTGKSSYYCYEIAKIYADQNQSEKAVEYLSQSISYGKKGEDAMLMYLAHQLMGSLLTEAEDYNKAAGNYQKALKFAQATGKNEFISEGLLNVALSYAQIGKHKRSIEPLEEALSLAIREDDVLLRQQCYELLASYHKKLGDGDKAAEYQTLHDNLIKTQQYTEENEQQLMELERQYKQADKEKKTTSSRLNQQSRKLRLAEDSLLSTKYSLEETAQSLKAIEEIRENQLLQIDLLNKDRELSKMQIREQKAQLKNEAFIRNSIIIGTLFAAAFALVVVRGYRKKLAANKEIDRQNKNIQSSINYAKRIQEAMLHKSGLRDEVLPDSFVLFKPRDSVSGDFYWISEIKSWYDPDVVIAAVDCTGHGIPGAFMSMIGMNALNTIIGQGIAESDQILEKLDAEIRSALQQEATGNKDGMDVALCIYRKEKSIIEFSGAKNPLVYIQNNELFQIKGDVHSIGGYKPKNKFSFKKHVIPIDQPTTVYLYSDGFQDQFGGENNTKFMSKKFKKLLFDIHHRPMSDQMKILEQTIEEWKNGAKQTDDILVMGFRLDEGL